MKRLTASLILISMLAALAACGQENISNGGGQTLMNLM